MTAIKRALISVSDKKGIIKFANALNNAGIEIISTGGTFSKLKNANIDVKDVSSVTNFPEILDGRVKTLHPKIHGGLLNIRGNKDHQKTINEQEIENIDLLVVNLYPFENTIKNKSDYKTCIENIDIGGPAMIRAAAKNHESVGVIVDPDDYDEIIQYGGNFEWWHGVLYAFGGVLIYNGKIDKAASEKINDLFFEIIIAPEYSDEALKILTSKKNRIILVQKKQITNEYISRDILNGELKQEADNIVKPYISWELATNKKLDKSQLEDLEFANKVVKHSKSNAIVIVKDKQMLSSGVGQTSRVDALKFAVDKAKTFNFNLKGSVMASDAFFPFPDCIEIASEAGIEGVVQPGGSIKDDLSIESCNQRDMSMYLTGTRHFYH